MRRIGQGLAATAVALAVAFPATAAGADGRCPRGYGLYDAAPGSSWEAKDRNRNGQVCVKFHADGPRRPRPGNVVDDH